MSIGDRIQNLRKQKGISQEELADRIGVSRQAVSKWESGQTAPDIEKIVLLSNYFDTTTDYLLKGIKPTEGTPKKKSALLFSTAGTLLNAAGLICSTAVWIERRMPYTVGIGLLIMLLGTGVFLTGQLLDCKEKPKAKYFFLLLNVWILLFLPMSCCFNVLDGFLGGFTGCLAPVPMLGNSLRTYALFWVIYTVVCLLVDVAVITVARKRKTPADINCPRE